MDQTAEIDVKFDFPIAIQKHYTTKSEDGGDNWYVEGYAATSDFDLQGDVISKEALMKSESQLLDNSTVLFNHHDDTPIGRVVESYVDGNGLRIKALISKTASDYWTRITEGVLNKFSISAKVMRAAKQYVPEIGGIANVIKEMLLLEVSLVSVPANPQAKAMDWYIGKALNNFEKEGGVIEMSKDLTTQNNKIETELDGEVSKNLANAKAEDNIVTDENGNTIVEKAVGANEVNNVAAGDTSLVSGGAMSTATGGATGPGAAGGGSQTTVSETQTSLVSGGPARDAGQPDYNAGTSPQTGVVQSNSDGVSPEASDQVGGNANINPSAPATGINNKKKGLGWLLMSLEDMDNYLESPDCIGVPGEVRQAIKSAIGALSPAAAELDASEDAQQAAMLSASAKDVADVSKSAEDSEIVKLVKSQATAIEALTTQVASLTKSMPVTRKGMVRSEEQQTITKGEAVRGEIQKGASPEDRLKIALGHGLI